MNKIKIILVVFFIVIGFPACGFREDADADEEEIFVEETVMQEESYFEEEENLQQDLAAVSGETEYVPKLLYSGDCLEVYAIGNIQTREEAQYTTEWFEQDYSWRTPTGTFLTFDDYICRRIWNKTEGDWYKASGNGCYKKCAGDEVLQEVGIYHDRNYRYNFWDFRWREDGCTFICRRYVKNEETSDFFWTPESTLIWIHKDFATGKEIQVIFEQEVTDHFVMQEGGFLYSVFPEENEEGKKEWIEIWEYNREKNKTTLIKRIDSIFYTTANIQTNLSGDIMVILQDVELDEYGREKDIAQKCTVFTSWDDFERGVELDNMEVQYYEGGFPYMMDNRILFLNRGNVRTIDRYGRIQDYLQEESVIPQMPLWIMENVLFCLVFDREDKPCDAGMIIVDLYGKRESTTIIEPVAESGIEYGLKEVNIKDGIIYGFFLNEGGDRAVLRKLNIPVSEFAIE